MLCCPIIRSALEIPSTSLTFETDVQVVALMSVGACTAQVHGCFVNDMLQNVFPKLVETTDYCISGHVDLQPILNLFSILNDFGNTQLNDLIW